MDHPPPPPHENDSPVPATAPAQVVGPAHAPVTPVSLAAPQGWGSAQTAAPVELPTLDFLGLLQVVARQKWIILLVLMAWTGLAVMFLRYSPRIYQSSGELEVESQDPQVRPYPTLEKEDLRSIDALKTVERNLQSPTLIARMIEQHDLGSHLQGSIPSQIAQVQAHSSIELIKGTRNVRISVRHQDPLFAKRVVEAFMAEFQEIEQEDKKRLEAGLKTGLTGRETLFREQLAEATRALEAFVDQHADLDLRPEGNMVGDKLADLTRRAAEARAKRLDLEKQLGTATAAASLSNLLQISGIAQLPEIQSLRSILHEKEAAFETLTKQFGPKHPDHISAAEELSAVRANLEGAARSALAMLRRDYQNARDAEGAYESELEKQKTEVFKRDHVMAQYEKLQNDVTNLEKIVNEVTTGIYQAEVNSGLDTHIISVRERPMVSEEPIWPNKPFILLGGLMAGLVCGLALAFSLETLRKRVRDQGDVEKLLPGVTCLTVLPYGKMRAPEDRLVLARDPHSVAAEGFRTLRTALYFQRHGEPRIIVITSPNAGDGKSYCAMNCAAAYAMQGYQTLLIDGDLRCPSLEETFLPGTNRGVTDFLRGRAEPPDICYPTSVEGLYFIPSGGLRPNPSELLAGPRLTDLLVKASQFFDKIVIDSAPLVPVSDSLVLSRHADALCLVVRSNVTKKADLVHVRQVLAKTGHPLAGYILNGASSGEGNSSYVTYMTRQRRRSLETGGHAKPALPARSHDLSQKAAIL